MTLGYLVHVIADGGCTDLSLTSMFQVPTNNENWVCNDGKKFQIHHIDNQPILLRFDIDILMGSVRNPEM